MLTIPQQPFGFVAGRWVLSMADTPVDADRAPDYMPLYSGTVIFKNKLSHRVVSDGQGGSIGIVKTRYEGTINENGQLVDANGNEFVALPVGVYTASFSFGQYSWPQFDFELTAEHTLEAPFWLPSESPLPSGPGVVKVVSEEARFAAEAAAARAELAAERAENALEGGIDYDLILELVEPLVGDAVSVGLAGVDDLVASALMPYATTSALTSGLAGKQDTGDYALVSQLPDLGAYATTAYVDQAVGDIDTALAGILGGN